MQQYKSLSIPTGDFKAYLFDCDGTIADTMPLHHLAWNSALSEWNCHFDQELFYAWAGIPVARVVEMLNQRFNLQMPIDQVLQRREEAYRKALPQIRAVESILEHIEYGYGKIPMGVVSGSPRESVIQTLQTLKLLDRFDVIIGAEDYVHGKPHPEPFLLGAAKLNVPPQNCLVFEDADLGVQSAKEAGMAWVKVE
jgi:HAD superfamily hydrolase (TIGR01509 family)